jgi:hypothetical protein
VASTHAPHHKVFPPRRRPGKDAGRPGAGGPRAPRGEQQAAG